MAVYLVVFGAALQPDGTLSGVSRRRVAGACAIGATLDDPVYLVTGGRPVRGRTEAEAIRDALRAAGVASDRIVVEPSAADTLESALRCDDILRRRGDAALVIPCSSNFHQPRCALLLRLLGHRVERRAMPADRPHVPSWRLGLFVAKEFLALPYDALLAACRRRPGPIRAR